MSVLYERRGHVVVLTLNRPEVRNAVDPDTAHLLEEAIDGFETDDEARVAVLTGSGTAFCAGADLRAIDRGEIASIETERGGFAGFVFRDRQKPIIAAVEGPAVAGGCELALACDLVVAAESASFALPEVKRGLIAAGGGLMRMGHIVGTTVAMELALTGEAVSARRAYEVGIVNRLAKPGHSVDVAMTLASIIAHNAPLAVRASRALILEARNYDESHLRQSTRQAVERNCATVDFIEGPKAFLEKRLPRWIGR